MNTIKFLLILLFLLAAIPANAEDIGIFFCEDFNDLGNWKIMEFPKIRKHSVFSIESAGGESYLRSESNASNSAIYFKKTFNVYDYPRVKWRWKVSNVYRKGNAEEKSGDDYPVRVFITFQYDPDRATFLEKVKHHLGKTIYGMEPPYSSLNYIWESRKHKTDVITSPYSPDAKMIILQAGGENAGKWMYEDVNIIRDYRRAFGEDPPAVASIAIMNDSDDTGESAVSFIDYIEVYR